MPLLLKNATLLSGKRSDVLLEGNAISKIGANIRCPGSEKMDASGKLLLPGFVNTHTHSAMSLLKGIAEDMQLKDWLGCVRKVETRFSPKQVHAGALLASAEMLKGGTTCFSDMYFHMDDVASAVEKIGIRATLGYGMADMGDEWKGKSELSIAEAFVKKWHGKAHGRIRCSIAPHSIYLCSHQLLQMANELSKRYSLPYHIHLSETRGEVFDCLKKHKKRPAYYLDSLGVLSQRTIAAHCVWLTKEEVRLLSRCNVSASLNPVSNMKLAGGFAAPMMEMQEFGMNISLGTDGSASNNSLSMFEGMKLLGLLQKNQRWDATVARDSALVSAATTGGADALGINCGKIKEGSLADLVLLDLKSPNLAPAHSQIANVVYSAHAGNVTDVIVDGKLLVENRRLLSMDEEKIIEGAQKEAEKLAAG
jgi:5-methylthioadenosine/S-adenosylhomocysteine deaminase